MAKIISLITLFLCNILPNYGQVNPNSTYVNGYYKSNGTYVNGYHRTMPNNTINDNYSTYPNVNPYTGQQGRIAPSNYTPSTSRSYSTPSTTRSYSTPSPSRSYSNPYNYSYPRR